MPVIQGKVLENSVIYTDGWKAYDSLIVNEYKHYRVFHSKNEFVRGRCHINGVESFWSFVKRRMAKQNGVRKSMFLIHLKESEFRWNFRNGKMYKFMLKSLRNNPI